jgi:hypothetical protein
MRTPRNRNQFTIASRMTATHERQGHQPPAAIVRDDVLTLGSDGQLVGIVSRPPDATAPGWQGTIAAGGRDAAFILLNAGVLHRVGPHRLHVALARRLAAAGLPGLRLDLGGIGDSVATSDAASFRDSAVADTRAAMTGLGAELGARRFWLFGICAGADNALATALVDDRVAGIALIDPPVYATGRSKIRHLRQRVAERGGPRDVLRWALQVAERRVRLTLAAHRRGGAAAEPSSAGREIPPLATLRDQLTAIADRGIRILTVYSGIHEARYNHADQVYEMFPTLRGRIDHVYFPTANHTFTELDAQRALIDVVIAWMTQNKRFG